MVRTVKVVFTSGYEKQVTTWSETPSFVEWRMWLGKFTVTKHLHSVTTLPLLR